VKNTKRIMVVLIIGIFFLSTTAGIFEAGNQHLIPKDIEQNIENDVIKGTVTKKLDISEPTFLEQDEFVTIELDQSETFMSHSGEPMLPVITKTFSFPIGTKINNVNVDINWERYDLDKKVTPTPIIAPISVELDPSVIEEKKINEDVYNSAKLFPEQPYIVKLGAGIEDMEHVVFVNVKCFPQYSPVNDYVNLPTEINIEIEHETGEEPMAFDEQYDLIIITHEVLEDEMAPLVTHKENMGVSTILVTVGEIYDEYESESPYDWEQIKMYLADHVVGWDTKFVLLAGGHMGQTHDWYVPDFRSHCWDPEDAYDPPYDETYASDLYYADVYYVDQYGKYMLEDWDSNKNDIYAEGPDMPSGTDAMDFYPDVHLGRLPIRYEWEADVAVNKIINYETSADDSWFKTAVLAGGDGFPPERYGDIADPDAWEGEIVCDEFANLLANRGVTSTKCYCSDQGDIQVFESKHVYNEVRKGCGFVHLTGHANPFSLGSYTPGTGISPPPLVPFYTGFNAIQFDCGDELPFMVCEGCHNAQFDVTGQELIDSFMGVENPNFLFDRQEWIPHDVSSWFVLQEGGGAIGVIGNTGLGLGGLNYGCTEFVGGWIMLRFAEAWGVDGEDYMGSVWTVGINGYIDNFDVSFDTGDRKTIEERALLGDPSLRLGGYGSSMSGDDSDPEPETIYGLVSSNVPTWEVGDSWTYALNNVDIDIELIEGREAVVKLSSGDIVLEVTDVTTDSYITSLKSDNIDVTLGGMFDFRIPGEENLEIPTVSFENIQIDGEIIFEKESLGIKEMDLGLIAELIENLDNIEDILQFEFPAFLDILAPYISIPANIDLKFEFDEGFEILQFPLENNNYWGFPANTLTMTIDGSIESIWLKVLNFLNKFIEIVPPELAQYLPDIDISEVLNDQGIQTIYEIDIPEVPAQLFPYHDDTTALFEVDGSEIVNVQAGQFNAAKISIMDNNGHIYYSEDEGNIVKIVGYLSEYVPIIEDLNLELKE